MANNITTHTLTLYWPNNNPNELIIWKRVIYKHFTLPNQFIYFSSYAALYHRSQTCVQNWATLYKWNGLRTSASSSVYIGRSYSSPSYALSPVFIQCWTSLKRDGRLLKKFTLSLIGNKRIKVSRFHKINLCVHPVDVRKKFLFQYLSIFPIHIGKFCSK